MTIASTFTTFFFCLYPTDFFKLSQNIFIKTPSLLNSYWFYPQNIFFFENINFLPSYLEPFNPVVVDPVTFAIRQNCVIFLLLYVFGNTKINKSGLKIYKNICKYFCVHCATRFSVIFLC